MKTTILISGQINGNFMLRSAINTCETEEKRAMFGGFKLQFPTKKQALVAMWEGYKILKLNREDAAKSMLHYSKGFIGYDASTAKIIN